MNANLSKFGNLSAATMNRNLARLAKKTGHTASVLEGLESLVDAMFVSLGFADKPVRESGESGKGNRYTIFGKSVTSVLRWMGKQGWEFEDARKAVRSAGCECSDVTIRIQLLAGADGKRGKPARLTKEQQLALTEAA